jgi:diguanylate cyclase (GGDEF)-like protein
MGTVERKLLAGFFCALAVLLAVSFSTYARVSAFIGKTRGLVATHAALDRLEELGSRFAEAQAGQRRFLESGSRAGLEACQGAFFEIDRLATEMRRLSRGQAKPLGRLAELEPLLAAQLRRLALALRGRAGAARALLDQAEARRAMAGIAAVLLEFRADENALMDEQSAEVGDMTQGISLRLAAGIALSLGIFAMVYWLIHGEMRRRKAAEAEARRRTGMLASVLQGMGDAVAVYGREGELIVCNPAAENLLGSPPVLFDDYPLKQALAGKVVDNLTMMMKRAADQESLFLNTNARPLLGAQGAADGVIITYHDVTGLKAEEAALQGDNAVLEQRVGLLKQHSRDTLALSRLVESLQVCRSPAEAAAAAAKALSGFAEGSHGALHLMNPLTGRLERCASWGSGSASGDSFAPEECLAVARKRAELMGAGGAAPCAHFKAPHPAQAVCVPLLAPGEFLGQMEICSAGAAPGFMNPERLRLLGIMAEQVGLALANLRLQAALKNESMRDALTGLYNRRQLGESLAAQAALSRRQGAPFSLAMFDIDFFKQFNDRFGHQAGDAVLREVALGISASLRQGDTLYRFGGEEFTAILPGCAAAGALAVAEKARLAVAALQPSHQGLALGPLSVSVGLAAFPESAASPEELIRQADAALYEAKHGGRNRSVIWSDLSRPAAA